MMFPLEQSHSFGDFYVQIYGCKVELLLRWYI